MTTAAPLPRLLDCRGIMRELGVTRATAEALMRQIPKIRLEGHRKVYVRRDDILRYLNERAVT